VKDKVTQCTVLKGYETRCQRQYYLPFSNTAHAYTSAWCVQHCSTTAVHFCISPELWPQQARAKQLITEQRMSCKWTKLKKSSS